MSTRTMHSTPLLLNTHCSRELTDVALVEEGISRQMKWNIVRTGVGSGGHQGRDRHILQREKVHGRKCFFERPPPNTFASTSHGAYAHMGWI